MGRARRVDVGGLIYHVLNRANFRSRLFKSTAHYQDFLGIVAESLSFVSMRILAYCLMPNHWHMVLYPRADGDLAKFIQRITLTHTQRYHAKTQTAGYGHVYQGRYKSVLVESDPHFLSLVRYVERNAKRAGLVGKAEDWPWSSVYVRQSGREEQKKLLSAWPTPEPAGYVKWVNEPQGREEVENIREAIRKGRPYGSEKWVTKTVGKFGLESTTRSRGRPKKGSCHLFRSDTFSDPQMRLVLDAVITTDDLKLVIPAGLDDMNAGPCAKTTGDDEGTIKGCGKSKKDAAKDAALGAAMGAGAGSSVGLGSEIDCRYYGNCGGPGWGTSIGAGAGIGAGTVLIYDLLKHEKHIILIQGTTMTFVINRSVDASTGKPLAAATTGGPVN